MPYGLQLNALGSEYLMAFLTKGNWSVPNLVFQLFGMINMPISSSFSVSDHLYMFKKTSSGNTIARTIALDVELSISR